jgi:adenosine deaminase
MNVEYICARFQRSQGVPWGFQVILGSRHPVRSFYAGVPVVIATDDEGVARSDLTNEYQPAVEEHHLSDRELKEIPRNSIEYSVLPAAEKSRLREQLETALAGFEAAVRRHRRTRARVRHRIVGCFT